MTKHKNFDAHRAEILRKMHDDKAKALIADAKAKAKAEKDAALTAAVTADATADFEAGVGQANA